MYIRTRCEFLCKFGDELWFFWHIEYNLYTLIMAYEAESTFYQVIRLTQFALHRRREICKYKNWHSGSLARGVRFARKDVTNFVLTFWIFEH